jgi:hypothetical protein
MPLGRQWTWSANYGPSRPIVPQFAESEAGGCEGPESGPRNLIVMSGRTSRLAIAAATLAVTAAAVTGPVRAVGHERPDVLVLDGRGDPLVGAVVTSGGESTTTDSYGRARLSDPGSSPVDVVVSHPRVGSTTTLWSGERDRLVVTLARPLIRALHIHGTAVAGPGWPQLLALADATAINALMIDVKDESGRVFSETASSWAHTAGAATGSWRLSEVVDELHARGLQVVVRIVAFQDPIAGDNIPEMAARSLATGGPFTRRGLTFLDPTDPDARAYALELAVEACDAGVDEVQFDYVRFPDGFEGVAQFDGPSDEASRIATITSFLDEAVGAIGHECAVAADIFGFVTSIAGDGGIGQRLEDLAQVTPVLSPMVYPNHWSAGWFGFDVPADHPGPVAYQSSANAIVRVGGTGTVIRPWLQDFGGYGPNEVRAQIDAVDALGLGWMVWNSVSEYTEGAIPTADELSTPVMPPDPYEQDRPGSGFWDVPDTSGFWRDVAWLAAAGITRGCNPPWRDEFCPVRVLTRAEAAALLARALDLPAGPAGRFVDDDGSTHEADIERLAAAGITRGCGPDTFCPERAVTRAEMAALLARALDLPAGPAGRFVDDDGSTHEADIERLAAAGITRGCGPDTFCPEDPVVREQVAAFLHRALG